MSNSGFSVSIEALLAPIPGEAPAGQSLRYEGTYDKILDARRSDDPSIPQGEWKIALKLADWKAVSTIAQEALTKKSKDLQVAAWLMEAWIELHGMRGLDVGLQLLAALADRYWDDAFPVLEEGDPSGRLSPIAWIDEKISLKIKTLPLTKPQGGEAAPYTLADWEQSLRGGRSAERTEEGEMSGSTLQQARFLTSASLTGAGFFSALSQDIEGSNEAAVALEQVIDSHLPAEQGSLRKLKDTLTQMRRLISSLHGTAMPMPLGKSDDRGGSESSIVAVDAMVDGPRSRMIQSRADAYRMLISASDYLLLTEPHSPTPYLVKRAISWGDMPLGKVLEEIVPSRDDLSAIYSLLGIRNEKSSD